MNAAVIDGRAIAARLKAGIAEEAGRLTERTGMAPGLAAILVGEDPASATYVRMKGRACEEAGFTSRTLRLPEDTPEAELLSAIGDLNADPRVHGILVQLPLPAAIDADRVMIAVDPSKDVDGFHPINVGRLTTGALSHGFVPATPAGILHLIRETGSGIAGAEAVVVGRSDIVGKPTALLLLHAHATVTICHSRTADLAAATRRADILVVAVGRPGVVTGDMVKPGSVVIDVGVNRVPNPGGDGHRLTGDVDQESVARVAGHLTPVPGGVGPMTIAMLLANTLTAARRQAEGSA